MLQNVNWVPCHHGVVLRYGAAYGRQPSDMDRVCNYNEQVTSDR
jgi:hypothetical protein